MGIMAEKKLSDHERAHAERELEDWERAELRRILTDYRRRAWMRAMLRQTMVWLTGGVGLFILLRDEIVSWFSSGG